MLTSPSAHYAQLRKDCAARGLRLTPQRDVLLRVLTESDHPTAHDLVARVRRVLPSVSHATVYRNLQTLIDAGLIGTLQRAGATAQFEINTGDHHHFVCRGCGNVWDVYLSEISVRVDLRRSPIAGFTVDRHDVQLHGLCDGCR